MVFGLKSFVYYRIYVVGILVLFTSCKNNKSWDNVTNIYIDEKKCNSIKISDVIHDMEIIPLETNVNCLISDPVKLIVTKKGLLIFDINNNVENVYAFSKSGRFLNRIGKTGHGRGELLQAQDVAADRNGDTIAIVTLDKKIHLYEFDGKYVITENVNCESSWIPRIGKFSHGYVTSTQYLGDEYQLHIYDSKLKEVCKLLPTDGRKTAYPNYIGNAIRIEDDILYYLDYHNSTFYVIDLKTSDYATKGYKFDDINMLTIERIRGIEDTYCDAIQGYTVNDGNIISCIERQNGTTSYVEIAKDSLVSNFTYDSWYPYIMDYYDGYNYCIFNQTDFLDAVENGDSFFTKTMAEIYKNGNYMIDDKSNHIIVRFKLKKRA